MKHEEAMQHGLGYASGREDASDVKTIDPTGQGMGWMRFAEAYAAGWDAYNTEQRFFMTNARDAYRTWQESNGLTIFRGINGKPAPCAGMPYTTNAHDFSRTMAAHPDYRQCSQCGGDALAEDLER